MYDIRQFRPAVYTVLLLSVAGYSIALESPLHFLAGASLILLNAWITRSGRALSMPRLLSSAIGLLTGAWNAMGLLTGTMTPLLAISQWLYFLLLVILWSRRDNRAYAQLLVMSLVLMVAGAINTASLLYGIILLVYLVLSLYCCLLFHLKVETDHAVAAYQLPRDKVDLKINRHEGIAFNRSLRRLTGLIATVALTMGVLVFLFFPRSSTPALMMRLQAAQQSPLTGFSERVSFDQVARITQNNDIVAHVSVTQGGKPWRGSDLYLRGMTLDVYTGASQRRSGLSWQWLRSDETWLSGRLLHAAAGTENRLLATTDGGELHQRILLKPTGSPTLFAMDGVVAIMPDRDMPLQYFEGDGSVRATDAIRSAIQYEVVSTGRPSPPVAHTEPRMHPAWEPVVPPAMFGSFARTSRIDPRIAEYARRKDVSGADAQGALATRRGNAPAPHALDGQIARNIQQHLQSEFRYTLDLTDTSRKRDEDPLAAFLYDFKRGHCEYFAGAMTLMCQSLGMKARMVIGFRAGPEDYNRMGDYYIIRQSHAHAWVEVLTTEGWERFDPTTSSEYYTQRKSGGMFRRIADFFDYLQYKWATSVVTYSNENRLSIWQRFEDGVRTSLATGSQWMQSVRDFFQSDTIYLLSSRLIVGAIVTSLLVLMASVTLYLMEKRKLYRRAGRIGLSSLPVEQQLRLARQLAFYDDLLRLLARQQIHRSHDLTPREFARSLWFLPADAYDEIGRVTDIYYRVRYGNQDLKPALRRRLSMSIGQISATLTTRGMRVSSTES